MTKERERRRFDAIFIPLGAAAMGGAERSIAYLAVGTQRKGKRVLMLAERALQSTHYPEFLKQQGLDVHWVDWAPERSLWQNVAAAFKTFRRLDVGLIQFNMPWRRGMWVVPLVARLLTRAKLVGSMRGMPDPHTDVPRGRYLGLIPGLRLWHLRELIAGWLWGRLLDVTVSVNERDFPPRLIRHYGYRRERMRVIHNGVLFRESLPAGEARNRLRAQAFKRIGEDPALRDRLARAARARAAARYRMESVVARYHEVYRQVVPGLV